MININEFRTQYDLIADKLLAISKLGSPGSYITSMNDKRKRGIFERGTEILPFTVDENGITFNSRTCYSGDTDEFSFDVSWEELNMPISYFEMQVENHNKKEDARILAIIQKENSDVANNEYELFIKLQKKYDKH